MRFIFITRESYREPGARVRCYNFSEELKEKGLDTSVFSFVDRLGAKSGKDEVNFNFKEKLKCIYKGYKLLSKEADKSIFIVNRFNYHTFPVWLISQLKKIPFIFDMDDWEAREDIGYYLGLIPKSKAEYLTRLFAKNSIFCIAASSYLRDYLLQFNKEVYYLPSGVDINKFRPSPYKEKREFIFSWHGSVNSIKFLKYIKFIIDCFLILHKKYPFIKLFIAADGIFGKELVKLIRGYDCRNIIYYGWIQHKDIPRYLSDVDVGLIPLLDRTHFNLSKCPVKLFEYMAMAKPTISSNIGESTNIIHDGWNGFLAKTKEEFIEKMEVLIKDVNLRQKLGRNAQETVEKNYSLGVLGKRLYEILSQINA